MSHCVHSSPVSDSSAACGCVFDKEGVEIPPTDSSLFVQGVKLLSSFEYSTKCKIKIYPHYLLGGLVGEVGEVGG